MDTGKLDYLVDMAGEMVIAQSMVRHDPDLAALKSPGCSAIWRNWRASPPKCRRPPWRCAWSRIGQLFQRMARLVRDLARKMGKQAELEISGEETELDRNIVEELADPLMHMVRNSLDHGIEDPDARAAAGKNRGRPYRLARLPPGRPDRDRNFRRRPRPGPRKDPAKAVEKGLIAGRRESHRQRSLST